MTALTLTDFLLQCIAQDEADARYWGQRGWKSDDCMDCSGSSGSGVESFDPTRVLAECKAKRRIVERYERIAAAGGSTPEYAFHEQGLFEAVLGLAQIYADRPGFHEEWRAWVRSAQLESGSANDDEVRP